MSPRKTLHAFASGNFPIARRAVHAVVALALVGILVGCGRAVATGNVKLVLIPLAAVGFATLAISQRGALIGLLVLAVMNGLPYFNTSPYAVSKFTIADVSVFVLLIVAIMWIISERPAHRPNRASRAVSLAGVPLLLWWTLTVVRTLNDQNGPFTRAASFGRDFAFFAMLIIVLPWVRLKHRDLSALLCVLGLGVCVFALGQIMVASGLGNPGSLIHFHYTLSESGLTRVYADMTDLVTAGLAVSVATALLARERRMRLIAIPVALLLTTSTVVQLTRARWIGIVVALVLVGLWLAINGDTLASTVRKRLALAMAGLGCLSITALLAIPDLLSKGTIVNRLSSVFATLQTGSGTVAIRESVTKQMTSYLGGHWISGLGFISPTSHYFFGLPMGSIRDTDLGVLNAVMTMGVIGAALVYLPVLTVLLYLMRSTRQSTDDRDWLRYGGMIWIIAALVSSVTLVTLFSPSGSVLSSVFIVILAYAGWSTNDQWAIADSASRVTEVTSRSPVTVPATAGSGLFSRPPSHMVAIRPRR